MLCLLIGYFSDFSFILTRLISQNVILENIGQILFISVVHIFLYRPSVYIWSMMKVFFSGKAVISHSHFFLSSCRLRALPITLHYFSPSPSILPSPSPFLHPSTSLVTSPSCRQSILSFLPLTFHLSFPPSALLTAADVCSSHGARPRTALNQTDC